MLQVSAEALQAAVNLAVAGRTSMTMSPSRSLLPTTTSTSTLHGPEGTQCSGKAEKGDEDCNRGAFDCEARAISTQSCQIKSMEKQKGITMGDKSRQVPTK